MDNKLKLKQSNNLILATHEMNVQQMRLFFYACSQYKGDLNIEIPLEEINRVLTENTGNRGGEQRKSLSKTIPTLMRDAIVHIEDEESERWSVVLTDSYILKDGKTVRFRFNKSIQKELEELRGYTWMYLSNLTGMSSIYSVRIYEFFAMRLGNANKSSNFDFDINKLRLYLDCTKKYKQFEAFERRVLKVAEKEINEKSNIHMSYKKIKTGRSITSILFTFKWKTKTDVIDVQVIDQHKPMNHTEQMELETFLKEFEQRDIKRQNENQC